MASEFAIKRRSFVWWLNNRTPVDFDGGSLYRVRPIFNIRIFQILTVYFSGIESISLSVRVGSSKHASGGISVDVKRIVNHENYSYVNRDYDIALVELAEVLNFTERIQSIQLSGEDDNIPDGALCRTSGWGNLPFKLFYPM